MLHQLAQLQALLCWGSGYSDRSIEPDTSTYEEEEGSKARILRLFPAFSARFLCDLCGQKLEPPSSQRTSAELAGNSPPTAIAHGISILAGTIPPCAAPEIIGSRFFPCFLERDLARQTPWIRTFQRSPVLKSHKP